jgi:hypothetical protein
MTTCSKSRVSLHAVDLISANYTLHLAMYPSENVFKWVRPTWETVSPLAAMVHAIPRYPILYPYLSQI